jgi:hypothetical protein
MGVVTPFCSRTAEIESMVTLQNVATQANDIETVLEKIGYERALPVLENLLKTSYDPISGPYLQSAVQSLRR